MPTQDDVRKGVGQTTQGTRTSTGGGPPGEGSAFDFDGKSSSGRRGGGGATDKVVRNLGKQTNRVRGMAAEKIRERAGEGKEKIDSQLETVADVANEIAETIEERYGSQAGNQARRAADMISSVADRLREKNVDELLEDGRSLVRNYPVAAFGLAALVGLALTRIVEAGLDEERQPTSPQPAMPRANSTTPGAI